MNAVIYNGKFPFNYTDYNGWNGTHKVRIMDKLPLEDLLRKNLRPKQLKDRMFDAYIQPIKLSDIWVSRTFTFSFNGECKNDIPIIDIVTLHDDGINPKTNMGLLTEEEYLKYKEGDGKIHEEMQKQEEEDLEFRKRLHAERREEKEYYKKRDEEYKHNILYGELTFSFDGDIKHVIDPEKKIFEIDCKGYCERVTRLGMELDKILNTTYATNNSWRSKFKVCILGLDDFTVRMLASKVADSIRITFDLTKEVRDGIPVITCKKYYVGYDGSLFLMILDLSKQITHLQESVTKLTAAPEPSGFKAFIHRLRGKFR